MTPHPRCANELPVCWRLLTTTTRLSVAARFVRESEEGEEGYRSVAGVLHTLAVRHGERALPLLREMALGSDQWQWLIGIHGLSELGAPGASALLEIGAGPQPAPIRYLAVTWLKHAYRRSPDQRIVDFLFQSIQESLCPSQTSPGQMPDTRRRWPSESVAIREPSGHC